MAKQEGTLEVIALEVGHAIEPLAERLQSENVLQLFAELGVQFPPALNSNTGISGALNSAGSAARLLAQELPALETAITNENTSEILAKGVLVVEHVVAVINAVESIAQALQASAGTLPGVAPAVVNAFAADLPLRTLEFLLVEYLEKRLPTLSGVLTLLGLIERRNDPGVSGDASRPPFEVRRLRLDRFPDLVGNPQNHLNTIYGWGQAGFDGKIMLQSIAAFLDGLGLVTLLQPTPDAPTSLEALIMEIKPNATTTPPGLKVGLRIPLETGHTFEQPLTDDWSGKITLNGSAAAGMEATITPPLDISMTASGQVQGDAKISLVGHKANSPMLLIGQAGGSRLQAETIQLTTGATAAWNTDTSRAEGSFLMEAEIQHGKLVISLSGADGFLGSILPGDGMGVDFDFLVGWNGKGGFYFRGSAALEIRLPVHLEIGPIKLENVYLILRLASSGGLEVELSVGITALLGPLTAVVEQIGAKVVLTFPGDSGNAPPANVAIQFKPPSGVGLAIDAAVVKGGGYLYFDFDKEEYAGILQLSIANVVTVTAIGLVTTRMPDGSKGFSLLIIISAEFATGIQLGFGFTLLGVGGLLGLNRTMRLQALAEGVRSGALNNIMFPHDVIANAPRIISDLRNFFPPENGKFLIGPMVKIGWGTPTLISLSLGIIIEIPGNIAIVGVLSLALPTKDAALLILQVSFIGAIEFDKKRVWFFATLFESRVLFFPLEGEMGLLMAFGDDAVFVLAVGGFHPRFNPPPLPFPSPIRVSFSILSTPTARIRVEGYFAVTSNTVQTGAHAELVFGLDDFGIEGHIGFDVLIQFSPFYLIAEISASVSLNAFGVGMFSIRLRFTLEGPTPWRARGSGSISLLFFEISADFDVTWGETRDTTLPPIPVIPLLKAEFDKIENWRAELPSANNLLVALRKLDGASEALVLHPVGTLRVSQRAVPLDLGIDKVGTQKPSDANRFTIEILTTSGLGKQDDAVEQFAIAQFQNMDDATKLSRPAFQPQTGGIRLSVAGQQLNSSHVVKRIARYEQIIIDNNFKRYVRRFTIFASSLFAHFLAGASVSKSTLSQHHAQKLQPFSDKVKVAAENYAVVFQANNQLVNQTATFSSEAAARDFLQQVATKDPSQAEEMHVIPQFEVMP